MSENTKNLKEQIMTLVKLQELEQEIKVIKHELDELPAKFEILDLTLSEYEELINNVKNQSDELNKDYRTYESDQKMNHAQIEKSAEKQMAVKTNKEYQLILKEIDELNDINSSIEDNMLENLEKIDDLNDLMKEKKGEYDNRKIEIEGEKLVLNREADEKRKLLNSLEKEYNEISETADPQIYKKYNIVKKEVRGMGIVPAIEAVCTGCNMNIPPQMFNELIRFDSLKYCPHCQRIIYWNDF